LEGGKGRGKGDDETNNGPVCWLEVKTDTPVSNPLFAKRRLGGTGGDVEKGGLKGELKIGEFRGRRKARRSNRGITGYRQRPSESRIVIVLLGIANDAYFP